MKRNTHTQVISRTSLATILFMALWTPTQLQSAEKESEHMMMDGKMTEHKMMEHKMAGVHPSKQEQRQKILAEMKAQDAELTAELARIKSAPEEQKMDLLIAVVTRMVEQRTAQHGRMGELMNPMLKDMPMDDGEVSIRSMPTDINFNDFDWTATNEETEATSGKN